MPLNRSAPPLSNDRFSGRLFLLAAAVIGAVFSTAPRAQDEALAPPDPFADNAVQTPGPSGAIGGARIPSSLLAPSRFRIGDFVLLGQASLAAVYDDNVEADDDERNEDVFLAFSPSVRAQSTYARHSLGFGAGATAATALKNETNDPFDWQIGADGRLDLSRRSAINASVGYSREVEDDEQVEAEDDDGDIPIHTANANVGYQAKGDRIGYSLGASASRLDIEGSEFDDRDNTTVGLSGALSLRWSEHLTFSAGPSYSLSTFDDEVADDGDSRDAERYGFRVGAGYRASRTISTQASVGYALLKFDDPDRDDTDSATIGAGLAWQPGNGLTLSLSAGRTLDISVVDDEDAAIRTSANATLSHQLPLGSRSAISSSLGIGVSHLSDFDRTDVTYIAGLSYAYRLSQHTFFTSSYRYSQRDSDDEEADYYRNLISLGLTISY